MLHPIDYRLSKNKFWLSTWNSYSLKNYRNLILNDKILNILGFIFKNCFKSSYAFASPWSNPRKNRKYFSNFVIGFDGRRAIRTGPNKVKKLPGFIIPEDYHIIRFSNFVILKIYFLIDRNLETYWAKKQKNWRSPIKYLNMRYNKSKNKENALRFNKNLFISNVEKKNFKSTGFFMYLINLLNNNSIKKSLYLSVSDNNFYFKKDRRHTLFRYYNNNFKLLNKIRNNYFLFYLSNSDKKRSLLNLTNAKLPNKGLENIDLYYQSFARHNIKKLIISNSTISKNYNKSFNFNYNQLHNFSFNYNLGSLKDFFLLYDSFNKNKNVIKSNYSSDYLNKVILNKKSIKSFTTFSFFLKKKSPISNVISPKLQLFDSLSKKSFNNLSINYSNRNLNNFSHNLNFSKFWFSNIGSVNKNLNKSIFTYENSLKISKTFYLKLNTKRKLNELFINLSRRRLPLLFFQGFNKGSNHLSPLKKKIHLNNVSVDNFFNFFNKNSHYHNRVLYKNHYHCHSKKFNAKESLSPYFKSKTFFNFFILKNRLGALANKFSFKTHSIDSKKNYLSINKSLISYVTNANKKHSKYLLNKKFKGLKNDLFFNLLKERKSKVLSNNFDNYLNLSSNKLLLVLSKNKWSNCYKILDIKNSAFHKKSSTISNFNYYSKKSRAISTLLPNLSDLNNLNSNDLSILKNKIVLSFSKTFVNGTYKTKTYKQSKSIRTLPNKTFSSNRLFWGKALLNTSNFNYSLNYKFLFKEYLKSVPFKSNFLKDKVFLKTKINNSLLEYKPFLSITQYNFKGYNFNENSNINFTNDLYNKYQHSSSSNNKILKSKSFKKFSLKTPSFNNKLIDDLSLVKWNFNKDFKPHNFFDSYYKKTFSNGLQRQDLHSKDDIFQIELRLNSTKVNSSNKFLKFKPYSIRSVSSVQRFKYHQSILTGYIKRLVKQNYLFDFYSVMENKKFAFTKDLNKKSFKFWLNNMLKAKGGILFKNLSNSKFNYLKTINYAIVPFFEKLGWLKFFNKSIKKKQSDPFKNFKKNKEKYILNALNLDIYKFKYKEIAKKVQFKYFKRSRWSTGFDNGLFIKNIIIKPNKPLLLFRSNYDLAFDRLNYSNNLYKKFNMSSQNFFGFNVDGVHLRKNYKYKLINYSYFWNNKKTKLTKFLLEANHKKVPSFVSFSFKSNTVDKKLIFNKSNNSVFNKYLKGRLSNIFLSVKQLDKLNKNSKIKKDDFDLRAYGLGAKLASPRIKFVEKQKRMSKLKPKTFLYWNHLKWFNLFIKSKFNSNVVKLDNFYISFNVYERFKKLNFNYYKNKKQFKASSSKISSTLSSTNFNKLRSVTYFTTFLRSKSSFLYTNNFEFLHSKKLLLSWVHSINFLTTSRKRLGYIPHIRYRALKSSMYMWKINSRKLNLLSKYYKARSKFYKNKLNFVSKNLSKSSIISYLRLMESNFKRIRKSMQRDLPLISNKLYLRLQLKKLNSYMKVLLKRKNKRSFLRSDRKNKIKGNQVVKWAKFYDNQSKKEQSLLPIKLFNFSKKRFNIEKRNLIDYVKKFIEHLFLIIFKSNNLRVFYIKKYQMNVMGTKAKLFKNLFNYRLATGFKIPFLVKVICKKLNFDKSLVGCKIGFFGRYSKKLRNRKIWRYVRHIKPSVISTPLDYYNILILQKWGITGVKLSMLRKKTFNFIFN